ncbi:MAG: hypothetical protein MUP16_08430, partial [Sedimentisphaerales bacterium]|nr:hypothetical protein [Sedimentisphaerales bacterium]
KAGKIAETEVLEARAGLAMRKSLINEADQAIVAATNSVRSFFSSSAAESRVGILPDDPLDPAEVKPAFSESLAAAFGRGEKLDSDSDTSFRDRQWEHGYI